MFIPIRSGENSCILGAAYFNFCYGVLTAKYLCLDLETLIRFEIEADCDLQKQDALTLADPAAPFLHFPMP